MEFLNLAEITVEVSMLIIFISVIRRLFRKKLNPNVKYFLWIFVAVRVLIPYKLDFSLELSDSWNYFPFSILTEQEEDEKNRTNGNFNQNFSRENDAASPMIPNMLSEREPAAELSNANFPKESELEESGIFTNNAISIENGISIETRQIFLLLWLCGVIFMAFYIFLNNRKLVMAMKANRRKIRKLPNGLFLYEMPGYNCLMGIFFPAIYVDADGLNNPAVVRDVIRHELQHYKVRDNYWQTLRVFCLILQWHNPLMWWAYFASKKDCEVACDARVVKGMSKEERYGYGKSLLTVLECAVKKKQGIGFHTSMGTNKKYIVERINAIMKYKSQKTVILSILVTILIGCVCLVSFHVTKINGETRDSAVVEEENLKVEIEGIETEDIPQADSQATAEIKKPTKDEVLAAREQVLKGMSEEEIERLKENIKVANQRMESAYLNDNIFEKLEDTESLYWNYFDEKGEIQIGWSFDGMPVTIYNRFHAENFINLLEEMKEAVKNEKLREDLQKIIDETSLAAETHEMEHAQNIYKLLHDMDYYLLRYGPEDVGKYVRDTSTISKYYGVLSVYDEPMTIIHENADILYYEDGAPYIHDILTNNTDSAIIETQYCMLAYDEKGSPLKLYWNFLDSSAESSFENIVQTKTDILPNQTENCPGGWSIYNSEVAYSLICLKQVVFEDGVVWDNPDYENWFQTYAGKETDVDELQNYYPHEYKVELN